MKMNLYVIMDKLAEECGPVFEAKNHAVAIRKCKELLKDYNTKDYALLWSGCVDHDTGEIVGYDGPTEMSFDYVDQEVMQ